MSDQISHCHEQAMKLMTYDKNIQIPYDRKIHGNCAGVVMRNVQKAFGMSPHAAGINSAKDFGPYVEKFHYVKSPGKTLKQCVPGDIVIYGGSEKHPHGHLQMLCEDGFWRSDHKQNTGDLSGTGNVYMVYSRQ